MCSIANGRLNRLTAFHRSSIGKKFVMALTGFIGAVYLLLHMLGNLQIFEGPRKLNDYAVFLKSSEGLLWTVRIILLAAVILHIRAAYQLERTNVESRPIKYQHWRPIASTYASRTMRWSGPILGVFIVYHLLHLTTGTLHPDFRRGDVYHNVVTGFHVWYASVLYIAAMAALCLHLYHGVWSMFQSVGLQHPKYNQLIRAAATSFTITTVIGFVSIPLAVLFGVVK